MMMLFATPVLAASLSVSLHSDAALLMNADTGAILYEKNSDKAYYPASTTKVATALYALSLQGDELDIPVTIEYDAVASISEEAKKRANYTLPPHWIEVGSTHVGLKQGEVLLLRDLLFGMMVASGNDASNAIARHIGGTISNFVADMNLFLQELGCTQTHFCNPHGLHHPNHITTARDMAIMARHAMQHPFFREMVKTVRYTKPKTSKQEAAGLIQTNLLLRKGKHYDQRAIGIKTGITSIAQKTLVAAATHNGRTLIAVLFKCKDRDSIYRDARALFDAAFSQEPIERVLLKSGAQKYSLNLEGAAGPIRACLEHDVCADYYPAEEPAMKCLLYWDQLTLPIVQGQRIGELHLMSGDGAFLKSVPVFAQEAVGFAFSHRARLFFSSGTLWKGFFITALIIIVAAVAFRYGVAIK